MNVDFKHLLILACIIAVFSCNRNENTAIVQGHTCGYDGTGLFLLDYSDDSGNHRDTIKVDKEGNFKHTVDCKDPVEAFLYLKYLGTDMANIPVYLSPGVDLAVNLDGETKVVDFYGTKKERYVVTPTFKGKTANESNYLNLPYKTFDCTKDGKTALSYKEFREKVSEYQQYLKGLLKSCCKPFVDERMPEIEDMQQQQLFMYGYGALMLGYKLTNDADFMSSLASIDVEDTTNCNVRSSLSDSYVIMSLQLYPELYKGEKEIVRYMKYLKEKINNPEVRERLSDYAIQSKVQFGSTDGLNEAFEIYRDLSGRSEIFKKNEKIYNGIKNIMPGMQAPDFLIEDINGNSFHFKDIIGKGKAVYVDFWATWCAPCCAEIPYMEKLAGKFKDNNEIVLISISVDNNRKKWEEKVKADNPSWPQYIISPKGEKEFDSIYNINGIPRFMLIDKNGCFIDNDTIRPSFDGSEEFLKNSIK